MVVLFDRPTCLEIWCLFEFSYRLFVKSHSESESSPRFSPVSVVLLMQRSVLARWSQLSNRWHRQWWV